ncbi:N-6 DNA methylase [Xenorhabdus thuongxuanensis]|uniref:site-specific DNA-methyltransferase (adenine-specific) n=1 Tax=Xenorhabdus thuongxuanensis TaxID=1873484 RepID=A0A1Q5TK09_9GAMM|nr:N-6 DNA methylase [Xenorhabdus thuongxuanensis]OKP00551.1 integrase [Xenorhabdus thuongxuanensis]
MSQLNFDEQFALQVEPETKAAACLQKKPTVSKPRAIVTDHYNEFIKEFNSIAPYHNRFEVFRDFIHVAAIALENRILKLPELEKEYFKIIGRYEKKDVEKFCCLLSHVSLGLQRELCDFLGKIFMSLNLGNSNMGQFFTPFEVSEMMAKMIIRNPQPKIEQSGYISVSDPAVGSGGMVIASAKALLEYGFDPSKHMLAICTDIDWVAARMCYVQLSLLGIPAIVNVGNSLTLTVSRIMYTADYYLQYQRLATSQ